MKIFSCYFQRWKGLRKCLVILRNSAIMLLRREGRIALWYFPTLHILRTASFICWSKIKTFLQELWKCVDWSQMILSLFGKKASCYGKKKKKKSTCWGEETFVANWTRAVCSGWCSQTWRPNGQTFDGNNERQQHPGGIREERERSTELFVERKYCLWVEVFGELSFSVHG